MNISKKAATLAALLTCLSYSAVSGAWQASPAAAQNTIQVSGNAEIQVVPDLAYVNSSITSDGKTIEEARSKNATTSKQLMDALTQKLGIDAKDIRTNFNISPLYDYVTDTNHNSKAVLKGYEATNTFVVTVRKIDNLGNDVDVILANGANRFQGITFGTSHEKDYRAQALRMALEDAYFNADTLAGSARVHIAGYKRIVQANSYVNRPQYERAAMAAPAGAPAPSPTVVAPGQITITASVTAEFGF